MNDYLLTRSAHRIMRVLLLAVVVGFALGAVGMSADFDVAVVVAYSVIGGLWAIWPAQLYHYRRYKQRLRHL